MSERTVFIIGAGASKEANLPTGDELMAEIADLLDFRFRDSGKLEGGDHDIWAALKRHAGDESAYEYYLPQALHIGHAMPLANSIDSFVDQHRDNEKIALCAKLAIVRAILKAEKGGKLYFRQSQAVDFRSLSGTWYNPFFRLLTEGCSKNELAERFKCVSLIVFNYDRCIEQFLTHALQSYYRIPPDEANQLLHYIGIYHPYGDVGIGFAQEPTPTQLLELARRIRTFAEGTDPESSQIVDIRKRMELA